MVQPPSLGSGDSLLDPLPDRALWPRAGALADLDGLGEFALPDHFIQLAFGNADGVQHQRQTEKFFHVGGSL